MKNLKGLFIILSLLIFTACTYDFNFSPKTDRNLHKKFQYSEKVGDVTFFYDVIPNKDDKTVIISFKNKSKFYMRSVAITINAGSVIKNRYLNLGSIKNNNNKQFELIVPSTLDKLTLSYEYYLSHEDGFVKSESYGGEVDRGFGVNEEYKKTGSKTLFIK